MTLAIEPYEVPMSNRSPIKRKKYFQLIICVIFLICVYSQGFSQDDSGNYAIEVESKGVYPFKAGDSKKLAKTMALFKAKRDAVELAGKYFRRKKLIEPYEHKRVEIYNILADEIKKDSFKEKWISISKPSEYVVKISVKISVIDFIRAEILNLEYEKKESRDTFLKKMEPTIGKDIKPGHCLAHAYRLIRKGQLRPAIIYLDSLKVKFPDWDDIYFAKSLVYYAMNELEDMKEMLKKACSLGADEACDDLKKIKRLDEHDFGL